MEIMISEMKQNGGIINITEEKWLLNTDFQVFFGLIVAMVSLTQLNTIFQTVMVSKPNQLYTKVEEDDFAKLQDMFARNEDSRTRSSTLQSVASG